MDTYRDDTQSDLTLLERGMTREEAWTVLTQHTSNPNLLKHMLAVEAVMRAYARRFGEDEETWGIVGLLHDLDYEKHPSQEAGDPLVGVELLRVRGLDVWLCRAILSTGDYSGVSRSAPTGRARFAGDCAAGGG